MNQDDVWTVDGAAVQGGGDPHFSCGCLILDVL